MLVINERGRGAAHTRRESRTHLSAMRQDRDLSEGTICEEALVFVVPCLLQSKHIK